TPGNSLTLLWTVEADNGNMTKMAQSQYLITFERGVIDGIISATQIARIYPNPATSVLNIEMNEEAQSMELIDMTGKSVMKINESFSSRQVSVDGLKNGVYVLKIEQNGKQYQSRVVIQNR